MRKACFTLLFVFFSFLHTNAQLISEGAKISLLTGSPGDELYSTFGHSAIRVLDPAQNLDSIFNYGTFDFNTTNFYVKFVRGQLDYKLSRESFRQLEYGFKYENRSVVEQELNLTLDQKIKLYSLLQENYKLENRYYKYDFFFDNCATRIRDIMITAFGDDFQYNYPEAWEKDDLTFRNLIDLYLTYQHWSDFGIDLALGLPTDAVARPSDYMFLPDYLAEGFAKATIIRDGKKVPFIISSKTIIPRKDVKPKEYLITPTKLMWLLFALSAALNYFTHRKALKIHWFDVLYFSVIGVVGWVVFLLWFYTDHIATKGNLNLLWAVPIYFPFFFFWNKLSQKVKQWIIIVLGGINVIILLSWWVFPQNYHDAFIPLILIILLRFFFLFKDSKKKSALEI